MGQRPINSCSPVATSLLHQMGSRRGKSWHVGPFEKWVGRPSHATLRVWGIQMKPECPAPDFLEPHLSLCCQALG